MSADALSISVVQHGPVRTFEFETFMFERFPVRLICPSSRENLMMSAAQCAVGAVLRFKAGRRAWLLAYLEKSPSEQ